MQTKEIEIDGKKFIINEIKYKDLTSFADLEKDKAAKQIMLISTGMTEEEFDDLSIKQGIAIQTEINKLNGLENFQKLPNQ